MTPKAQVTRVCVITTHLSAYDVRLRSIPMPVLARSSVCSMTWMKVLIVMEISGQRRGSFNDHSVLLVDASGVKKQQTFSR